MPGLSSDHYCTTYLELAPILTESFTCSRVGLAAGAAFLPLVASRVAPTVPKIVPSARYSFLMARPRITLETTTVRVSQTTTGERGRTRTWR